MKPLPGGLVLRHFGVRGLKIYSATWFLLMYALLVCVAGRGLSVLIQLQEAKPSGDGHDSFIIYFTIALTVAAAALLTRMLLRRWEEIRQLPPKTPSARSVQG